MAFIAPKGTELIRFLGGGSVFEVALVRLQDAEVVCKRLVPNALDTREGRAAMIREARLCAMVDHPALPKLIRVGNDWRGPFFLQSYIAGESLSRILEAWRDKGFSIPDTLVRHIAVQAFSALAEIAELSDEKGPLGIVHGDIGPDHILLGPFGEVSFVDLGAARFRDLEPELLTDDKGTLPFVAPEVARGEVAAGQHADVYALAASLLFFGVGQPLCHAKTDAAILAEVATQGVRRELFGHATAFRQEEREILHLALDLDPQKRPKTAREILDVLLRVEQEAATPALR